VETGRPGDSGLIVSVTRFPSPRLCSFFQHLARVSLIMQQPARLGIITKPNEPRAGELAARIAAWAAEHQINLFVNDRVKDLPPGTFSASAREIVDNCDC